MPKDNYYADKKLFCSVGKEIKTHVDDLAKKQARPLYELIDDALRTYLKSQNIELKTTPKRIEMAQTY